MKPSRGLEKFAALAELRRKSDLPMAPYIYALIVISIGGAAVAEILVEREKRQMKKQFLDALDKADAGQTKNNDGKKQEG
jgi:hypothetical protein